MFVCILRVQGSRSALAMAKDDATRAAFEAHASAGGSKGSKGGSTTRPTVPVVEPEVDKKVVICQCV